MTRHKLISLSLAFFSIFFVIVLFYQQSAVLESFEAKTFDLRFKTLRGAIAPNRDIAIIAIDEKTLAELGRFPFTRRNYTQLIDQVTAAGAKALLMDAFFPEQEDPATDQEFAAAMQRSKIVTLASAIEYAPSGKPTNMVTSLPELTQGAKAVAHINFQPDEDGVNRQTPLVLSYQDKTIPSLGLSGAMAGLGETAFRVDDYSINIGTRTIPLDAQGMMLINYIGPPGIYPRFSFSDVSRGRVPAENLRGKILFMGATALGIYDMRVTPFHTNSPGVEVHANIADSIIRGSFIRRSGLEALADLFFIICLGAAVFTITARLKPILAVPLVVAVMSCHWGLVYLFFLNGAWLGIIYPLVSMLISFILSLSYRFIVLDRHAREIRSIFSSYVSSKIVDQLVSDPGSAKIGGDSREITILFSDLRGFTTYSESVDPYLVLKTLNEYLDAMTRVIMDHDGTVDKFLGDGIMAYWGAPLPQKNHAERAMACTLAMAETMKRLQQKWQAANVPSLFFRIGIHTGEAIAGNIGAQGKKMEYTVIGDTINLASRLEGTAKYYGVDILASQMTRQAAGEQFLFRELDRIRVVGKSVPITIYELLGKTSDPLSRENRIKISEYSKGLELYRQRRFAEAKSIFAAILADMPRDTPTLLYLARCDHFLEAPPPEDWDGVFDRTTK